MTKKFELSSIIMLMFFTCCGKDESGNKAKSFSHLPSVLKRGNTVHGDAKTSNYCFSQNQVHQQEVEWCLYLLRKSITVFSISRRVRITTLGVRVRRYV